MKPESIFLLCSISGPRIQYVVAELFERRLGLQIIWVRDLADIPQGSFSISYGAELGRICIPESPWLTEGTKHSEEMQPNLVQPFKAEGRHIWNMDILGLTFGLLSRLEETEAGPTDQHKRFPFNRSILSKNNQQEVPWIDLWAFTLRKQLLEWGIHAKPLDYEESVSFDIDNPTAFLGKGFIRNTGGILADLANGNLSRLKKRIGANMGLWKDPYDLFDEILEWLSAQNKQAVFFVWVGDYGPNDKGLEWKNPHLRRIVQKVAKDHKIGLHPSYRVLDEPARLAMEKERLENIIGGAITHSRFHFLRFQIPESYSQLIEVGIEWDHSLGYSEAFGFRAGTSHAFRFYDVGQEKETSLMIQPFSMMDSTAYYGLSLSREDWNSQIIQTRQLLKGLDGHLNVILHNDVSFLRYPPDAL